MLIYLVLLLWVRNQSRALVNVAQGRLFSQIGGSRSLMYEGTNKSHFVQL